jgi:hypothetical protein
MASQAFPSVSGQDSAKDRHPMISASDLSFFLRNLNLSPNIHVILIYDVTKECTDDDGSEEVCLRNVSVYQHADGVCSEFTCTHIVSHSDEHELIESIVQFLSLSLR